MKTLIGKCNKVSIDFCFKPYPIKSEAIKLHHLLDSNQEVGVNRLKLVQYSFISPRDIIS